MSFKAFLGRIAPPTGSTATEKFSRQKQLEAFQREEARLEQIRQEEAQEEALVRAIVANDPATVARQRNEPVNCWFCDAQPEALSAQAKVEMHRELPFYGNRKRWTLVDVFVPRCETCKSDHDDSVTIEGTGTIVAVIVGGAILIPVLLLSYKGLVFVGPRGILLDMIIVTVAAFIVGLPLKLLISSAFKIWKRPVARRAREDYPTVKTLVNSGWKTGLPLTL